MDVLRVASHRGSPFIDRASTSLPARRSRTVEIYSGLDGSGAPAFAKEILHRDAPGVRRSDDNLVHGEPRTRLCSCGRQRPVGGADNITVGPAPVSEPSTMLLVLSALPFLKIVRRKWSCRRATTSGGYSSTSTVAL